MAAPQVRHDRRRVPHLGDEHATCRRSWPSGIAASRIVAFSTRQRLSAGAGRARRGHGDGAAGAGRRVRADRALAASGCSSISPRGTALQCALLRLNYAIDLRYGVLLDIGTQGVRAAPGGCRDGRGERHLAGRCELRDACARSRLCSSPPALLNLTGPETLSVRSIARRFGERLRRRSR